LAKAKVEVEVKVKVKVEDKVKVKVEVESEDEVEVQIEGSGSDAAPVVRCASPPEPTLEPRSHEGHETEGYGENRRRFIRFRVFVAVNIRFREAGTG